MKLRIAHLLAGILVAPLLAAGFASMAAAGEVRKIAVMTPEDGTDFGWNQQGVEGAKAAAAKHGIEIEVAEGLGYGDIRPVLRELAAEGIDLIIAHASGYNTAAPEVAKQFKVPVAVVDTPGARTEGLVADYTVAAQEGAYLAGMLAAKMTRTGTLGIVVSGEPPSWNIQSAGFALGARAVRPDVAIRYAVIGPAAYADVAGGKRVTASVIASGADIVFGQGNGSSFGMIQAVETTKAVDGGKAWFIDVIGDKTAIDKGHLLSSVLWDFAPIFSRMIEDIGNGTYGTTNYDIGLSGGAIDLLKTRHIPDGVWSDIVAARAAIINGGIEVPSISDAAEMRKLMTSVAEAAE